MLFRMLGGIIDRLFALAGALSFSQTPLFIQQYRQQLFGRVEELNLQVKTLKNAAELSDKTIEQYIAKFIQNSDSDFSRQGLIMQEMVQRWTELNQGLFALNEVDLWKKPIVFIHYYNKDVAEATWRHFEPGISLTAEGGIYAFIGMAIGFFMFFALKTFLSILWKGCLSLFFLRKAST